MITLLSHESVDENFIRDIFHDVLGLTLSIYKANGYNNLEPMGSEEDMNANMPKIAGSILRACQTYYNTAEEQLVQIISSITINHYLENGNKRTAVSAGLLYLTSYSRYNIDDSQASVLPFLIDNIEYLKYIADAFANKDGNIDEVTVDMIDYAHTNIFSEINISKYLTSVGALG